MKVVLVFKKMMLFDDNNKRFFLLFPKKVSLGDFSTSDNSTFEETMCSHNSKTEKFTDYITFSKNQLSDKQCIDDNANIVLNEITVNTIDNDKRSLYLDYAFDLIKGNIYITKDFISMSILDFNNDFLAKFGLEKKELIELKDEIQKEGMYDEINIAGETYRRRNKIKLPDIVYTYNKVIKSVVAQNEQVKKVLTTIYANQKLHLFDNDKVDISKFKSNMLIVGSTGVGKTEIIRQINDYLNIPMVIEDANRYTAAGYVGANVDEIIEHLIISADNDIALAEHGIVVIDEIDKLAGYSNDKGISTTSVQQSLLKLIEGGRSIYEIEKERGSSRKIAFDTSGITVIGLGAFSGIEKIIDERVKKTSPIGFGNSEQTINMDKSIAIEDLIKYGMIPEFIGRFSKVIQLSTLELDDLKKLLTDCVESPLYKKQIFFKTQGVQLEYSDDVVEAIAKRALQYRTGARALKAVVEEIVSEAEFKIFADPCETVRLTKETVENPKAFVLK